MSSSDSSEPEDKSVEYRILGCKNGASVEEVRERFRIMALKFHPDKCEIPGATEIIKELNRAYNVLSNNAKQSNAGPPEDVMCTDSFIYDYSKETMVTFQKFFGGDLLNSQFFVFGDKEKDAFGACSSIEVTEVLFGCSGYPMKEQYDGSMNGPHKMSAVATKEQDPQLKHSIYIPLEDILKGITKKLKLTVNVLNPDGLTTRREEKILLLNIAKGCPDGTSYIFPRCGDQSKEKIPADVCFFIEYKQHPLFERVGLNLRYVANITLKQALCGATLEIPTLEDAGVPLHLTDVINTKSIRKITRKGLQDYKDLRFRGDIIVNFEIEFPQMLNSKKKLLLMDTLPD